MIGGETGVRTQATCYSATPLAGEPLNHLGISPNKISLGIKSDFVKLCYLTQEKFLNVVKC